MHFDRVYNYTKAIRDAFGSQHYIWIYTNGDLVTESRLKRLAETGLNEIRFNIAARDYDLEPLSLAVDHVPHVTVEIAAIPEDIELVKSILPQLEFIGVKNINLHQLMLTDYNAAALRARGYTVLRNDHRYDDWFGIVESEVAALKILNHAAEKDMGIGVNYCSRLYKYLFQGSGFRWRYAPLCRSDNDEITPTGYLRCFTKFENTDSDEDTIDLLDPEEGSVKVAYYSPKLSSKPDEACKDSCGAHLVEYQACLGKGQCAEFELTNPTAKLFFQLLFMEKYNISTAIEEVMSLFEAKPEEQEKINSELREFYYKFAYYEYIPQHRAE